MRGGGFVRPEAAFPPSVAAARRTRRSCPACIQRDILSMLLHAGLNAGAGMEGHHGVFGRSRDRPDEHRHICGIYRGDAETYPRAVLSAAPSCVASGPLQVVDMGAAASGGYPSVMASKGSSVTSKTSSSWSSIGMGNPAAGGRRLSSVGQTLLVSTERTRLG